MPDVKSLHIRSVPFADVQKAIEGSTTLNPQRQFNTHEHTIEELTTALPNFRHNQGTNSQPWLLLHPWLDLIVASQNINPKDVHRIRLPNWYCDDLVRAGRSWQLTKRAPSAVLDDLAEGFPQRTEAGEDIRTILSGKRPYFMRLDTCSLKDAEHLPNTSSSEASTKIGNVPVTQPAQLWQRILTSARGCRGVSDVRQADEQVYLVLLPWREDVAQGIEFRVFCAPGGAIAAVSQYTWHAPLQLSNEVDLEAWCQSIFGEIQLIHRKIVAAPAYSDGMAQAGFTFDVLVVKDHVQLVELNTFGAMTGCGSCLFHWIDDATLLYGLHNQVEMRVTR